MTDWTTLNYAVIDVEGNGQQPPDLVELAMVPIRCGVTEEPAALVAARLFVKIATRVTTLEELRGSPPGKEEDDVPSLF